MADDLKNKILSAATDLFRRQGVRVVTIDDVCRQINISKKTFYQYYQQKEDLVYEAASYMVEERRSFLAGCFQDRNPVQIIRVFSELLRKKAIPESDARMASDLRRYYPAAAARISREKEEKDRAFLQSFFVRGVEEGYFRQDCDLEATVLLLDLMNKGALAYFDADGPSCPCRRKLSRRRVSAAFMDILCHILFSDKGWEEFRKDNDKSDE